MRLSEVRLIHETARVARGKALESLAGATDPALRTIRQKLARPKPSANLHWLEDLKKIIVIDME